MDVLGEVKRIKPARVFAVLADGGEVELSLGDGKGRWGRLSKALADLTWTALRCLDGKARLLRTIVNDTKPDPTEPGDPDDDGDDDDPSVRLSPDQVMELRTTREVLRAQRIALMHDEHRSKALFESQQQIIRLLTDRLTQHEKMVGDVLALASLASQKIQQQTGPVATADDEGIALLKQLALGIVANLATGGGNGAAEDHAQLPAQAPAPEVKP